MFWFIFFHPCQLKPLSSHQPLVAPSRRTSHLAGVPLTPRASMTSRTCTSPRLTAPPTALSPADCPAAAAAAAPPPAETGRRRGGTSHRRRREGGRRGSGCGRSLPGTAAVSAAGGRRKATLCRGCRAPDGRRTAARRGVLCSASTGAARGGRRGVLALLLHRLSPPTTYRLPPTAHWPLSLSPTHRRGPTLQRPVVVYEAGSLLTAPRVCLGAVRIITEAARGQKWSRHQDVAPGDAPACPSAAGGTRRGPDGLAEIGM